MPQLEPVSDAKFELYAKYGVDGSEMKLSISDARALEAMGFLTVIFIVGCVTYYLVQRDCVTKSGQRLSSGQKVQAY